MHQLMDESEKRSERLKAMRMQADMSGNSDVVGGLGMPGNLSNPLLDAPSTDEPCAAPRFDYYTDPMAAFSSNRKKGMPDRKMCPPFTPPSFNHSPGAPVSSASIEPMNAHMASSPQNFPGPYGNPVWDGTGGSFEYRPRPMPPSPGGFAMPRFNSRHPPFNISGQSDMQWRTHNPNMNTGQNNIQWHSSPPSTFHGRSRSPNIWRGRDWQHNNANPGSGRGGWQGGQGQGYHCRSSGAGRPFEPSRYYRNSMVEDPWKSLKPVVWKGAGDGMKAAYSSNSYGMKKLRTSNASDKSSSEPSLAEYLAASLHEAARNEANED